MTFFVSRQRANATINEETALAALRAQLETVQQRLDRLASHVAGLSQGVPIGVEVILEGKGWTEIPADRIDDARGRLPELLILDVRSDVAWEHGHLEGAKHVAAQELSRRLHELPDRFRPLLVIGASEDEGRLACRFLMQEGYHYLFYADGGLAAYPGTLKTSDHPPLDVTQVTGSDPALIARVAALLDRDVRPALVRDGGDLELLSVDDGVVQLRMVGACHGCGAQTMTVQQGIRTYLLHAFPELKAVQDLT